MGSDRNRCAARVLRERVNVTIGGGRENTADGFGVELGGQCIARFTGGPVEPDHGQDGTDDGDDGDDRGAGEDDAQDAGASAQYRRVLSLGRRGGFGGLLVFFDQACHPFGMAELLVAAFLLALQFLVFREPGSRQVVAGGLLSKAVVVSGFGGKRFGLG